MKERLSFRPDGSSDSQWREQRGPRPGKQERDAIKRGERPFWRGQSEAGPSPAADSRPEGGRPGPRDFGNRPPPDRRSYDGPRNYDGPRQDGPRNYDAPRNDGPRNYDAPRNDGPRNYDGPRNDGPRSYGGPRSDAPRPWEQRPARPEFGSRPPARPFRARQEEDSRPAPEPEPKYPTTSEPRPFYDRFATRRTSRPKPEPKAPRPPAADQGDDEDDDDVIPAEEFAAMNEAESTTPVSKTGANKTGKSAKPVKRVPRDNRVPRSAKSTYQGPAPTETQKSVPELVARIIKKVGSEVAADLALRQELKRRRTISPDAAAQVSRAVFRHYRWLGWLKPDAEAELQIAQANGLAEAFRTRPTEISDADLRAKAVPAWTWDVLSADAQWLRALQTEPQLWLRARPGHRDQVASQLNLTRNGPLKDSLVYDGTENLFKNRAFQAGEFEIQDLASQAVGLLCAPEPGQFWWDTCAGEGGKTLHLADLMEGKGLVYASDRAEWRLERLRMRASRAQCFNFRAVAWQGGSKPPTKTAFDGILVDAPCSGIGTWTRNPHARWTTKASDVTELAEVQRNLLENVAPSLKPGGKLVYAVCTLSRAETTAVADAFTAQHPEFEPVPMVNPFAPESAPSAQLAFWPQQTLGNGMFVAAWRKKAQ